MALVKTRIREVPPEVATVAEDDFYLPRFRYVAPRPYTREDYEHLYDWMIGWGLLDADSHYDRIVSVKTVAAA